MALNVCGKFSKSGVWTYPKTWQIPIESGDPVAEILKVHVMEEISEVGTPWARSTCACNVL